MNCHICGQEAVERCFTCGELFCEQHGKVNCNHCETGYMPGDRRGDRISHVLLPTSARPGWWRPQEAEDYEPPACYECKGLARLRCRNCGNLHCPEHAGKGGLCQNCTRSARAGAYILAAVIVFILAMVVLAVQQSSHLP